MALHRANEDAFVLFHQMLLEGREAEDARACLTSRGFRRDAWVEFGIGTPRVSGTPSSAPVQGHIVRGPRRGRARSATTGRRPHRFRGRTRSRCTALSGQAVGISPRAARGRARAQVHELARTPVYHTRLSTTSAGRKAPSREAARSSWSRATPMSSRWLAPACPARSRRRHRARRGPLRLASPFPQRMVLAFDSDKAARRRRAAYAFLGTSRSNWSF